MQIPSLRRMIGQMLLAGFPGAVMPDAQALRLMEEYSVGNFILFARNIGSAVETARVCGALSEAVYAKTGFAPFLAVDQEGGAVLRAHERSLVFPGAMALAAATHAAAGGDVSPIREVGRRVGNALRALGMNVNFAPVLDVNSEPQNPVIGVRAYGDSPATVTACGLAMAEGLRAGGVLPVFKHFPGHGNVSVDSHIGLPVNDAPRAALERTEWATFSAGVSRFGMDAGVMTAHLVCRALEGGKDVPGTLSPRAVTALLRQTFGFSGLVFTDCMEMGALTALYDPGEAAVRAVEAGCDVLTISHTFEAVAHAADALQSAVESGRIPEARIEASFRRILAVKERLGLLGPQQADPAAAEAAASDAEAARFHAELAGKSITLLSGAVDPALAELRAQVRILAPEAYAQTGAELDAPRVNLAGMAAARFGWHAQTVSEEAHAPTPGSFAANVLCLRNARFSAWQQALLRRLEAVPVPLVVVLLGGPYDLQLVRRADVVIAAYEYTRLSAGAVLAALETGAFPGECPVRGVRVSPECPAL